MEEGLDLLIGLFFTFGLVGLGYTTGKFSEVRHLRSLEAREEQLKDILLTDLEKVPPNWAIKRSFLVVGSVVIATDYFKIFSSALRNLFGGEMKGFRTLMERARREAIVRMLEEARRGGASAVWNVRLETSTIGGKQGKNPGGAEITAYGTALRLS